MTQTNMQLGGDLEGPTGPKEESHNHGLEEVLKAEKEFKAALSGSMLEYDSIAYPETAKQSIKRITAPVANGVIQRYIEHAKSDSSRDALLTSLFASELMNLCESEEIRLDLTDIHFVPNMLGHGIQNKKVFIEGYAGSRLGQGSKNAYFEATCTKDDTGRLSVNSTFIAESMGGCAGSDAKNIFIAARRLGLQVGTGSEYATIFGKYLAEAGASASHIDSNCIFIGDTFTGSTGRLSNEDFLFGKNLEYVGDYSTNLTAVAQNFEGHVGIKCRNGKFVGDTIKIDPNYLPKSAAYIADSFFPDPDDKPEIKHLTLMSEPHYMIAKRRDQLFEHPHFQALYNDALIEYFRNNSESAKQWAKEVRDEMTERIIREINI